MRRSPGTFILYSAVGRPGFRRMVSVAPWSEWTASLSRAKRTIFHAAGHIVKCPVGIRLTTRAKERMLPRDRHIRIMECPRRANSVYGPPGLE